MASVRRFDITPSQFEEFKFQLSKRTKIHISLIATDPVNIFIFDNDEMYEYEKGDLSTYTSTENWNRKAELEADCHLDAGTWHIVVEGSSKSSRGRINISP